MDKVGRYFPFSVLVPVPGDLSLLDILCEQAEWLNPVEEALLHALDEGQQVDELLARIGPMVLPTYLRRQWFNQGYQAGPIQAPCVDVQMNSAVTGLLEGLLATSFSSHSIWTTQGSDRIDACVAIAPGLPAVSRSPSLRPPPARLLSVWSLVVRSPPRRVRHSGVLALVAKPRRERTGRP